jgi:hypothetical protein
LKNARKRDKRNRFFLGCSVFGLHSLVNTRKRDKPKNNRGKTDIDMFVGFVGTSFRPWTFCKNMFVVFVNEPPLTEKRPKTYQKQIKGKKKSAGGSGGSGI